MNSQIDELVNDFNGYGIEVFYGRPFQFAASDFEIDGLFCLMEYCEINDIKTVLFDCRYAEKQHAGLDQIKEQLEKKYKEQVSAYLSGINRLAHITESFYEPVWTSIIGKIEQEYTEPADTDVEQDDEDKITQLFVWTFHQGIRVYTEVELEKDESEHRTIPTQKEIIRKYMAILRDELFNRHMEAYKENQRLEKIRQQTILDEIAQEIKKDNTLGSLPTVKSRNDYADRICAIWQIERGHEWLTKKAVRSIIEVEYAHRNENRT